MGAAGVDAHVVVKTAVGMKFSGEKTGTVVCCLKHESAGAVGEDRGRLLIVPVEILADCVSTDDEHVSICRIRDDELRRRIQRCHKTSAGAVDIERACIHCAETMLHDH